MEIESVGIGENGAVLTAYIQKNSPQIKNADSRAAVLVLPGGGYEFVSDPENEPVALEYAAKGFQAFTLDYSVGENGVFPNPQLEVVRALATIRANADRWYVDAGKTALVGFSAGGHLAASVGVHWQMLAERASLSPEVVRPNALVLVYPCITADEYSYPGIKSVHGKGLSDAELPLLNLQNYVGKHTPPSYICHSAEDTCVPVMNSILFAEALARSGVPFEAHIFKNGPHGIGLATRAVLPDIRSMPPETAEFLKDGKVVEHIRKAREAFSVWTEESVRFLSDVFSP